MSELTKEIASLRAELAEMKAMLMQVVAPATSLSVREEADIVRAAVRKGGRKAMIQARKQINGEA